MVATLLLLMAAGIGLTQAVSDARAVTLRWLRLGGLIAVTLAALGAVVHFMTGAARVMDGLVFLVAAIPIVAQLMLTQLGKRTPQRIVAWLAFFIVIACAQWLWTPINATIDPDSATGDVPRQLLAFVTLALSAGLLGGYLMTMLLGHAYLTSGNEMTQQPFERLTKVLLALLVLRLALSLAAGLYPWYVAEDVPKRMWSVMMLTARYLVGLVVPLVFTLMSWECVRRRANQSATGILYVASVLVVIGEGLALALQADVGVGV